MNPTYRQSLRLFFLIGCFVLILSSTLAFGISGDIAQTLVLAFALCVADLLLNMFTLVMCISWFFIVTIYSRGGGYYIGAFAASVYASSSALACLNGIAVLQIGGTSTTASKTPSIAPGQRLGDIAVGQIECAPAGALDAILLSLAVFAAFYFTLYLSIRGGGFHFSVFITHIRASHIRTSTKVIKVNDSHIAPEQRHYIKVIAGKDFLIICRIGWILTSIDLIGDLIKCVEWVICSIITWICISPVAWQIELRHLRLSLDQLVAFGPSLAAFAALYFTLYLPACGDGFYVAGFYFAACITHIRAAHIRTLPRVIIVNDPHIAPEQRHSIAVIIAKGASSEASD